MKWRLTRLWVEAYDKPMRQARLRIVTQLVERGRLDEARLMLRNCETDYL